MNIIVQLDCLFSKLPRFFVDFTSASIFYSERKGLMYYMFSVTKTESLRRNFW
jgi:hypothetical protein